MLERRPQISGLSLSKVFWVVARVACRGGLVGSDGTSVHKAVRGRFFGFKLCHNGSLLIGLLEALNVSSVPAKQESVEERRIAKDYIAKRYWVTRASNMERQWYTREEGYPWTGISWSMRNSLPRNLPL
jgi:hypothetical protein